MITYEQTIRFFLTVGQQPACLYTTPFIVCMFREHDAGDITTSHIAPERGAMCELAAGNGDSRLKRKI